MFFYPPILKIKVIKQSFRFLGGYTNFMVFLGLPLAEMLVKQSISTV